MRSIKNEEINESFLSYLSLPEQIRKFEILILRPLQIVLLASAVFFIINSMWLWLIGSALSLFYLGIVGSKLHPIQSGSELSTGPLSGTSAALESELLPLTFKQLLVGQACTRVGLLVGSVVGILVWAALEWRWYLALIVGVAAMFISGAMLKIAFRATGYIS